MKSPRPHFVIILALIFVSALLPSCSSRKGFPTSTEHRKKSSAIMKKSKVENKKRFQFLTRDKIQYKKYQPSVPF